MTRKKKPGGYDYEVLEVEEPAKVSHAEAVAAGLVFENWMRKNMPEQDVIIMRKFVDEATKKGEAGPKKQQAIPSYYNKLEFTFLNPFER